MAGEQGARLARFLALDDKRAAAAERAAAERALAMAREQGSESDKTAKAPDQADEAPDQVGAAAAALCGVLAKCLTAAQHRATAGGALVHVNSANVSFEAVRLTLVGMDDPGATPKLGRQDGAVAQRPKRALELAKLSLLLLSVAKKANTGEGPEKGAVQADAELEQRVAELEAQLAAEKQHSARLSTAEKQDSVTATSEASAASLAKAAVASTATSFDDSVVPIVSPYADAMADADLHADAVQQQNPAQRWKEVQVLALRCVLAKLPVRRGTRRSVWPAVKVAFDRVVDHVINRASALQWSDNADIASVGPTRGWSISKYYAKAYTALNARTAELVPEAVLITKLQLTEQDAANVRLLTDEAFLEIGRDDDHHVRLDWLTIWTPAAQ
jgi:hypothetical protein